MCSRDSKGKSSTRAKYRGETDGNSLTTLHPILILGGKGHTGLKEQQKLHNFAHSMIGVHHGHEYYNMQLHENTNGSYRVTT